MYTCYLLARSKLLNNAAFSQFVANTGQNVWLKPEITETLVNARKEELNDAENKGRHRATDRRKEMRLGIVTIKQVVYLVRLITVQRLDHRNPTNVYIMCYWVSMKTDQRL